MKIVLICLLLLVFACTEGEATVEKKDGESVAMQAIDYEEHYVALREKALSSADPQDKLDAFIYVYEHARPLRKYLNEAIELLVEAADENNTIAQYNLGYLLQTGTYVEEDKELALSMFKLAANRGHILAQLWSGLNIEDKYFSSENLSEQAAYAAEVEHWMRRVLSSELRNSEQKNIARSSLGGILLSENIHNEEGWRLLQQAATENNEPSYIMLGLLKEDLETEIAAGDEGLKYLLINLNEMLLSLDVN